MIPELPFVAPWQTSSPASNMTTEAVVLDSSLAMAAPIHPQEYDEAAHRAEVFLKHLGNLPFELYDKWVANSVTNCKSTKPGRFECELLISPERANQLRYYY